ncbi:MAG: tail fiber protein [Caulobacter sp.]
MAEFFMGQVMMTGYNFAQKYFAFCNGQLLPIQQNTALFSLLGTYYGGNGVSNFALPDLRGRAAVGYGSSVDPSWQPSPYPLGMVTGTENVTLLITELPAHTHNMTATTQLGAGRSAAGGLFATSDNSAKMLYGPTTTGITPLNVATIGYAGSTQPHSNLQPYEAVTFVIALSGIYPSRN